MKAAKKFDVVSLGEILIDFTQTGISPAEQRLAVCCASRVKPSKIDFQSIFTIQTAFRPKVCAAR
jgi:hypothetical protein